MYIAHLAHTLLNFNFNFFSPEDVERCKQKDLLAEMLAEMTGDFPTLYKVFVLERDQYLARSLKLSATPIEIHNPDGGNTVSSCWHMKSPLCHLWSLFRYVACVNEYSVMCYLYYSVCGLNFITCDVGRLMCFYAFNSTPRSCP